MASSPYDWDAPTLLEANQFVIKKMIQYLQTACEGDTTSAAIKFIANKLQSLRPICDFHQNIANGIVQVDANFEGTINKGTQLLKEGYSWKIRFTIDADIPPSGSIQKKHIGFEIHFKTKKKQTGHAWCDAVPKGRPDTSARMNESTTEPETHTFPNTDTVTYSLTTYTI